MFLFRGDVIDAGSAFHPPLDEYIKQLDFEKSFLDGLNHHAIPMVGNHEVPVASSPIAQGNLRLLR